MGKRKKSITYTEKDGTKLVLDDAIELDLSGGSLEDLIVGALEAEDDDEIIKSKANEIREYIESSRGVASTLERWYNAGKILTFVDSLKLQDESLRKEAFERLFSDLNVDSKRNPQLSKVARYPEHMYTLAKLPINLVFTDGMTWSKWFDILEYKEISKNRKLLQSIVHRCTTEKWNAKMLRKEIQKANRRLQQA